MRRTHHLLVREVVERLSDADDAAIVRRTQAVRVVIEWPDHMPAPSSWEHETDWRVAEVVGEPWLEVVS